MKQTVEIWDKQSSINGIAAETYLNSNPSMRDTTVLLVKQGGSVTRIEDINIIKSVYGLEGDDSEIVPLFEEIVNRESEPEPELTPLERAIKAKLAELDAFDTGEGVNSFSLGGMPCWITADERAKFNTSISCAEMLGEATIELPLAGQFFTLPLVHAKMMLAAIQRRYADRAAIVTAKHKAAITTLATVEEVDAYDFTTGYPEKIVLEIPAP
jgi:hypothetical protein